MIKIAVIAGLLAALMILGGQPAYCGFTTLDNDNTPSTTQQTNTAKPAETAPASDTSHTPPARDSKNTTATTTPSANAKTTEKAALPINITILGNDINTFAPGVDAAIGVTPEQLTQIATAYDAIFDSNSLKLAKLVMQSSTSTPEQRKLAEEMQKRAVINWQKRLAAIYTDQQRDLIKKIESAYKKIYDEALAQMYSTIKTNLAAEMGNILTANQSEAMHKAKAALDASQKPEEKTKK